MIGVFGVLPYLLVSGWLQTAHAHAANDQPAVAVGGGGRTHLAVGTTLVPALHGGEWTSIVSTGTTVVAGALLLAILVRHTSRGTPELAVAAALAAILVASAWVMPWYGFAALPLFALRKPNLLSWAVALYSAFVLVGEQYPALTAGYIGGIAHQFLQYWVPVCALIACVAVIVFRPREVLTGGDAIDAARREVAPSPGSAVAFADARSA